MQRLRRKNEQQMLSGVPSAFLRDEKTAYLTLISVLNGVCVSCDCSLDSMFENDFLIGWKQLYIVAFILSRVKNQ